MNQHRVFHEVLLHGPQRAHLYIVFVSLLAAVWVSYRQPYGLLFSLQNVILELSSTDSARDALIKQHKEQQQRAVDWMERLARKPNDFPNLISNRSSQLRVYDYIHAHDHASPAYSLLHKPKQAPLNTTDHILISILYGKQDTDHREGKFYVGQVLHHLLRNYHPRFLITLCENNNTNAVASDGINLIREIFPVFVVNSVPVSAEPMNTYEREKQAHLQCILANFQSFPQANHLLLMQDDAEPISDDFYRQLIGLIDDRIGRQWPPDGSRRQPAFVKIYHPRWLISYLRPSLYLVTQLIVTSFLLTCCAFAVRRLATRSVQTKPFEQRYHSRISINNYIHLSPWINRDVLFFIGYFLLILVVLLLIDHTNVSWTWRSLHPAFYAIYPAPSCCLPGVLFFRQTYVQVTDYLSQVQCHRSYAIDTAFDDLPRRTQLHTYLVEPNLVHHIGLYSRLRRAFVNPYLLD